MQSQWALCSLHSFAHKLNPHSINTIFVKQDETNWPKITRPNMDILISNGNKKCFHRKNELSESQICLLFISFMEVFEKKEWKQDRRTEEILTASFGSCNIPTINGKISLSLLTLDEFPASNIPWSWHIYLKLLAQRYDEHKIGPLFAQPYTIYLSARVLRRKNQSIRKHQI